MPQSLAALYVHLVFSTKHREPWLTEDLCPRLYPFVGGIVRERKCILIEIGGAADHVHALVSLGREMAVAPLIRDMKSVSSLWIHAEFPTRRGFAWQAGYGAFSVSESNIEAVRTYVQNQSEHHRRMTFQEELRHLLEKHKIEWDERYVWD